MEEVTKFESYEHKMFGKITTSTLEDGTILFKANDVALALGYTNPQKAVRDHCKGVNVLFTPTENQYGTVVNQPTKYISESDVYRLVMRSKLPEAEKFQDWVCEDVLPSIRKHGAYMTNDVIERTLTDPDYLIRLATQLKEERQKRIEAEAKAEDENRKRLEAEEKNAKLTEKNIHHTEAA